MKLNSSTGGCFVLSCLFVLFSNMQLFSDDAAPRIKTRKYPQIFSIEQDRRQEKNCGHNPVNSDGSEFSKLIAKAVSMVHNESGPLCVIEVGTADGSGTTQKLFDVLQKNCENDDGREFVIFTYESDPTLASIAASRWSDQHNVVILCDLVMREDFLVEYVMNSIEGPDGDEYPNTGFYKTFYNGTFNKVANGEIGGFLRRLPSCTADLVLVDSTRYAHPGIIATLLSLNLTRPDTVFLIENDFWSSPDGDERRLLERRWRLADAVSAAPAGEMWPWLIFRVAGPQPAPPAGRRSPGAGAGL